jgi:N6-adenosine-specific RNA methylase IME4
LADQVAAGEVSVSAAADVATLPKAEQREVLSKGDKSLLLGAAKKVRADRETTRRGERIEKIAEIAKGNAPLAIAAKFPVIYADPPWRYEHAWSNSREIENHYPTMSLHEICSLPVRDIVTDDAILYMWATAPKLAECMQVIAAWGFDYRTNFVWVKDKIGMGYHARSQHEILLVAKRGSIPPPAVADRVSSVVMAERAEHSAKPVVFYDMIESFYPTLPKIELFCRSPREGWAVWGNQSERAA